MKHVIITGTNGMIGSLILKICLDHPDVEKITSITRKPIGIKHNKLTEVIHQNFLDFSGLEQYFKNQNVCFYCVGVYTGQVPSQEFKKITVDYTSAFVKILNENSKPVSFNFLSGQGADSTEKSNILFAREKGIAENILLKANFSSTHIFRPGYIYPVEARKEPNIFYKIMRVSYVLLKTIYPNVGLKSTNLAQVMVSVGLSDLDKIYFENKDIRLYNT